MCRSERGWVQNHLRSLGWQYQVCAICFFACFVDDLYSHCLHNRIWDLAGGGGVICDLEGHNGTVYCVAMSADGQHIVSGSADKSIK